MHPPSCCIKMTSAALFSGRANVFYVTLIVSYFTNAHRSPVAWVQGGGRLTNKLKDLPLKNPPVRFDFDQKIGTEDNDHCNN